MMMMMMTCLMAAPLPDDGTCEHLFGAQIPSLIHLPSTSGGDPVDLSALPRRTVLFCYPMTAVPNASGEILPPRADWDSIPGARGCTPEACSFRDLHAQFLELQTDVYGLSTQVTSVQQEVVGRLHLPYPLLSDAALQLTTALRLPLMDLTPVAPAAPAAPVAPAAAAPAAPVLSAAVEPAAPALPAAAAAVAPVEPAAATPAAAAAGQDGVHQATLKLVRRMTLVIETGVIVHVFYPVHPPAGHAEQVLQWLKEHAIAV